MSRRRPSSPPPSSIARATPAALALPMRHGLALRPLVWCIAAALAALAAPRLRADVLPTAPQVVGGQASVSQSGNQQTVLQSTDRAIINWGSFSIGAGAGVSFIQPSASSVVLNRVTGNDPSSILGTLSANGQVFLVNPNGVFFGAGARVDTAGLVATTMSIADTDFMAGRYSFLRDGSGSVRNEGLITIREGGYVLLAADSVSNAATGQVIAPRGSVMLASADRVTFDTRPDGLVGFSVQGEALRDVAQVENAGLIAAAGGQVALSARAARELTGLVVNNTGVIRAQGIEERDGAVILSGSSGATLSSGSIDVSGVRGGSVEVVNASGVAAVSGAVRATGDAGAGGSIVVAGATTGLLDGGSLDASGSTGGSVRVGGEYRGAALAPAAGDIVSGRTYVAAGTRLSADGRAGQGGRVVVWADEATRFDGMISATGAGSGRGGDAEVSGKQTLAFNGNADLSAQSGVSGTLLLDPANLRITDSLGDNSGGNPAGSADADFSGTTNPAGKAANSILANTSAGADSTISRGKLESVAANANIVLEATNSITLENLASGKLDLKTGAGNSVLLRTTGDGSSISFVDKTDIISTQGGNISVQAQGAGSSIDIGGLAAGAGQAYLSAGGAITTSAKVSGNGGITYSAGGAIVTNSNSELASTGAISLTAGTTIATAGLISGGGTVSFSAVGNLTTTNTVRGDTSVSLSTSGGALNTNAVQSTGAVTLSGTSMNIGNVDTDGGVTLSGVTAGNSAFQKSSTRIKADSVTANLAGNGGNVDLRLNNEVNSFSGSGGSYVGFKSTKALSVGAVTVNNAAGANIDLSSNGKLTVNGAVSATADATHAGSVLLTGGNGVDVKANVTATGGGGFGAEAAKVTVRATSGGVSQTAGQIKALDIAALAPDQTQYAHAAIVTVQADNGGVSVNNVLAQADGGRGQVYLNAKSGVTVSGTVKAQAASQPGVSINAQYNSGNSDVDTSGGTLSTVQTAEAAVPGQNPGDPTLYKDPNKVLKDAGGGIGIVGRNLNLGAISTTTTVARAGAAPFYGIATSSTGNTTFNQTVSTTSDAGISVATTDDGTVRTQGSGLLRASSLALSGDEEVAGKGVFNLKTDVSSLTVLGGRGVTIDNSSHVGQLTISALGRISEASTLPDGTTVDATTLPVGGVFIKSDSIKLVSLDNRTTSKYAASGAGASQQDLILWANTLDYLPGTIKTRDGSYVELRPLDAARNVQVVYSLPAVLDANTTYYTGGTTGLLNQFHPEATLMIGGVASNYGGNITLGADGDTFARQISLGSMDVRFETTGRFYNKYATNVDTPTTWTESGGTPYSVSMLCSSNVLCLAALTKGDIYIRDSYKPGNFANTRNVVITGKGTGVGGTQPENDQGVDSSSGGGGGNGGGNNNQGGGGGTGTNNNDSQPGGSNAPPTGPEGGGNDQTSPQDGGTTVVSNNPGTTGGNPGGNPGQNQDPSTPGNDPGTSTDPGGNGPDPSTPGNGDTLAGGGEFSGDPGGNPGNNPGGDPDPGNTGTDPGGGGVLTGDPGNTNPGNNDNGNNPGDNTTPGNTGGGTLTGGDPGNNNNPPTDTGNNPGDGTQVGGNGQTPGGDLSDPGNNGNPTTPPNDNGGVFSGDPGNGTPGNGTPGGDVPGNTDPGSTPGGGTTVGGGSTTGSDGTPSGTPGNSNGNTPGDTSNNGGFAGGGSTGTPSGDASPGNDGTQFSDGSTPGGTPPGNGSTPGGTQTADGGGTTPGSTTGDAGNNAGNTGNNAGTTTADGGGSTSGGNTSGTNPANSSGDTPSGGNAGNNTGNTANNSGTGGTNTGNNTSPDGDSFAGGAGTSNNTPSGSPSDSGSTFSDGTGGSTGSTSVADGGSVPGNTGSSGSTSGPSTGDNVGGNTGNNAGNNAGNTSGGNTGGNSSGTQTASSDGGSNNTGSNNAGSNNAGSNSNSSGNTASSGNASNNNSGSTGDGSNTASNNNTAPGNNSSSNTAAAPGAGGNGNVAAAGDEFEGAASGGASSQAGTPTPARNTVVIGANAQRNPPPCDDEGQAVRSVSRPGTPNSDLLRLQGSGMRLRGETGSVQQQRASCARQVSQR